MKKSNSNMSEEELDALFQEAASSFQPPDKKKEIWSLLEHRLERNVWYLNRNVYTVAAAILILILLTGIFIYSNFIRKNETTKKDLTEEAAKRQQHLNDNEKIKNKNLSINKVEQANQQKNNAISKGYKNQSFIADKKTGTKEFKNNNKHSNKMPFINNLNFMAFSLEGKGEIDEQIQTVFPPDVQYRHLFETAFINPVKGSIDLLATSKEAKNEKKKKVEKKSPFSLQIIAGPDWSTVKLKQWRKPAWDMGLMIGYRFAKRWTVQTGIITGGKNYHSYPKDFEFPDNTPDKDDINEVTSKSHVLTVPLNIIYSLSKNKHHSLSVSLGLSSYWFLTEEYTYHYKSNTGLTDKRFEIENINKNILSIMNVSPVYEYYLNKNVSLMAAPYFQLPFSKIGYGQVGMQSAGINVGAAYYF